MKRVLILLSLVICHWSLATPVWAIYDPLSVPNNRFGIHILEPNELDRAAQLINSSGGDWGYVTIPIRANDRDLEKWTNFMLDCQSKKVIPILRIATFPRDTGWAAPNEYDLVDFAIFLNQLPWPVKNRYIVVYNEPNHQGEWGGFVYPAEYARVLDRAINIFKNENDNFFVISAGMDAAASNTDVSMNEYQYFREMASALPGIFSKIDGFSSHAYGNPGFSADINIYARNNIASYRFEQDFLCRNFSACELPVFITEAGWRADLIGNNAAEKYYTEALSDVWVDNNIVAITPFLFEAQGGPFEGFSFVGRDSRLKGFAEKIKTLPKTPGKPIVANNLTLNKVEVHNNVTFNTNIFTDLIDQISSFLASFLL